jgi:putative flavoprotein involved in K+ transport
MRNVDVVVVGAGHAGLAVSHALADRGVEHVVLERDRVGQAWRDRWESFCLVTPNRMIALPGLAHDGGEDPDAFMPRDDIVGFLERYASTGATQVREGVEVTGVRARAGGGFSLDTSDGELSTSVLVACTGAYQRPHRPAGAVSLPPGAFTIDATDYRRPDQLPPGDVLVVGSGQTGCQLAEELLEDGREVVLACGRAPWVPRRLGGHDITWWGRETGFLDQPVSALPDPRARLEANLLATGHGGGHDLHYRTLQTAGVTLAGHFLDHEGGRVRFADDLADCVAWGDERHRRFMGLVRTLADERGIEGVEIPEPEPFDASAPQELPLDRFAAVIFTGGFRPNYGSWLPWPEAVDDLGFPVQADGASTVVDGLYFCGVHFMRKRKSSILWGTGEDAEVVAGGIAQRLGAA